MNLKISLLLLIAIVCCLAGAEVVNFHHCSDVDEQNCNINEVRVIPCPQAEQNAACKIRRRKPTTMSFDFTPNFDADSLEASLTWVKSETEELPLVSLEKNACLATSCPVRSGVKQTYTLQVPIESKFPTSSYTIRWFLQEPQGKRCCFKIDIKVVR